MKLFDKFKIGALYKGSDLRKLFPGVNSTFLVNFKSDSLEKIINYIEQNSFYNYIFVFTATEQFLNRRKKSIDFANDSKIIVAFKSAKNFYYKHEQLDEKNFERMNVEVPGFYRQGSYLSGEEQKRDWKLVHKKPGFRLKPETEKHFGDILTGLNFNESYKNILRENMDYLDIGQLTKGEEEFIKLVTNDLIDAAYNNRAANREGYVGILIKMGNLFEKATGYPLPDYFIRKFFYVSVYTSYFKDGNQFRYIKQNYIDKYKLNLILPATGGFWVFSVVNALIMKLIDHHKRKEIYDKVLPLISRYFISGLHDLSELVILDSLYSKDEIEKLKNYFVRRKLKPETDKHFGDILTSL